jgi:dienelactone hydrolase
VDSNYKTIAKATARATTGFSEGGYCAATLALRHPTVFGTAIPFSAYYFAGEANVNAGLPFAGSSTALADASPMILAARLSPADRAKLYFIVIAQPSQPLYGYEATAFERLLFTENYQFVAIDADVPHGWDQVRDELPSALEAWAKHLAAGKVFQGQP